MESIKSVARDKMEVDVYIDIYVILYGWQKLLKKMLVFHIFGEYKYRGQRMNRDAYRSNVFNRLFLGFPIEIKRFLLWILIQKKTYILTFPKDKITKIKLDEIEKKKMYDENKLSSNCY